MNSYKHVYNDWKNDPERFWMDACQDIHWYESPSRALFETRDVPFYSWFKDGLTNSCYNAVDRHVAAGRGDQIAILYDSPISAQKAQITYYDLQQRVAILAGALATRGFGKGDRVVIYMPNIPEALIAIFALARLGVVHSVVFGGFAPTELSVRIDDAKPKAILTASCGFEPGRVIPYKPLVDKAIDMAKHKPDLCLVYQRAPVDADLVQGRDYDWHTFQQGVKPTDCVPVKGDHPAYILYTSGTTGDPKGIVRPTGGHLVALHWTMRNIYNVQPGDVYWAASDIGWVVGHSYICYAPLIYGATTIAFEGKPVGTPDAGTFWRIIEEYKVKCLFTAPTALRAIKREDPQGHHINTYNTESLRSVFLAGERADPDTVKWAQHALHVPVVDHWWQTETGYAISASPLGLEVPAIKIGSAGLPMPGYDVSILDQNGNAVSANTLGSVAIKLPLPPGTLSTLWNAEERFHSGYLDEFPGYYKTGDAGYVDEDGYLYIMARTDDVINVAGHRFSTGAFEEIITLHKDVAECAVIGAYDALKGQIPVGFLCLNKNCNRLPATVVCESLALVREKIGAVASFKHAYVVDKLPKTRSGKILRATITKIANGQEYKTPPTLDDPSALESIAKVLHDWR